MGKEDLLLNLLIETEIKIFQAVTGFWNIKANFITGISLQYTYLLKQKDIFIKTTV